MKTAAALLFVALFCVCGSAQAQNLVRFPAQGQVPPGYPPEYAALIAAAEREGNVVIYSNTDIDVASFLINDFQAVYPKIGVEYHDLNSNDLNNRFLTEALVGRLTADVIWSSAMDLQFNLVSNGLAQAYNSPEISGLPTWAVWKNQAFGTTFEPVALVFNNRLMPKDEAPQTRADLTRLLNAQADRFTRKVVTYDIEKSEIGFLLAIEDAAQSDSFWNLAKAFGDVSAQFEPTTKDMLQRIGGGASAIAYNAIGSYAMRQAASNDEVSYLFPKDYTLVLSRIMFIGKNAGNPNAARLWVDYVLSRRGQSVIAGQARLGSLRSDVTEGVTAASLQQSLGASLRPIAIGPNLIEDLDYKRRQRFIQQWKESTAR